MKRLHRPGAALAGVTLAAAAGISVAMAAPLPAAGYSSEVYYVVSANVSGGAGQCFDAANTWIYEEGYYPGPNKSGARERRTFVGPGGVANLINVYPVTPAAGSTTWSGTFTSTILPGGSPLTETFSSAYVFTDAYSTTTVTTVTYPVSGGGTCTTKLQGTSLYTGK